MTEKEFRIKRIGFLEGVIEGVRLYAVWKDGKQLVGIQQRPLESVLLPFEAELTRLQQEASTDAT